MNLSKAKALMPRMKMTSSTQEMFQHFFLFVAVMVVGIAMAVVLCMLIGWPGVPITLFSVLGYLAYGPLTSE